VPFPALYIINSHLETVSGQACIPINLFLFLLVDEFYSTRYQSGFFSLINVGSGSHRETQKVKFAVEAVENNCLVEFNRFNRFSTEAVFLEFNWL
jgi:hypothetical protein